MEAFRPTDGGGARASFAPPEAALLRNLIEQVVTLLGDAEQARPSGFEPGDEPGARPGFGPDDAPGEGSRDPGIPGPAELAAMLGMDEAPARAPEDPALARLLPDAYRDDPDAAGEFRRYTEQSLRLAKQETARTVLDTLPADGGPVRLSGDEAQAWLRTLNDVRLALGVRLEVTEEFEDQWQELDAADPRSAAFEVYAWLGGVQDSLVQALT
ncbi:MAG TPA: DUF2017 domain-containing protein [Streptosporangiaceae bacterium]|jgi:hypothetical protein|nr:DUF2017 domain-containing protein [Streptosporangiaceae bacterium]